MPLSFPFLTGAFEVEWTESSEEGSAGTARFKRIRWVREASSVQRAEMTSAPPHELLAPLTALREALQTGKPFAAIPWSVLDLSGCTDFQRQVFAAIARIPHGETRTYGWVASQIQRPAASRAVGQALKSNPFPIYIPCHRVVSVVSLGGFMGQQNPNDPELRIKERLLELEERFMNPVFSFLMQEPAQAPFAFFQPSEPCLISEFG